VGFNDVSGNKIEKAFVLSIGFTNFLHYFSTKSKIIQRHEKQRHCPCPPGSKDLQRILPTFFEPVALYKIHFWDFIFRIINGSRPFSHQKKN